MHSAGYQHSTLPFDQPRLVHPPPRQCLTQSSGTTYDTFYHYYPSSVAIPVNSRTTASTPSTRSPAYSFYPSIPRQIPNADDHHSTRRNSLAIPPVSIRQPSRTSPSTMPMPLACSWTSGAYIDNDRSYDKWYRSTPVASAANSQQSQRRRRRRFTISGDHKAESQERLACPSPRMVVPIIRTLTPTTGSNETQNKVRQSRENGATYCNNTSSAAPSNKNKSKSTSVNKRTWHRRSSSLPSAQMRSQPTYGHEEFNSNKASPISTSPTSPYFYEGGEHISRSNHDNGKWHSSRHLRPFTMYEGVTADPWESRQEPTPINVSSSRRRSQSGSADYGRQHQRRSSADLAPPPQRDEVEQDDDIGRYRNDYNDYLRGHREVLRSVAQSSKGPPSLGIGRNNATGMAVKYDNYDPSIDDLGHKMRDLSVEDARLCSGNGHGLIERGRSKECDRSRPTHAEQPSSQPREQQRPKSILRKPTAHFPEDPNPIREGVAPLKDALPEQGIPPQARWTKIDRRLVCPQALTEAQERFEARPDYVIVLRVLKKSEIDRFIEMTKDIRWDRGRVRRHKG